MINHHTVSAALPNRNETFLVYIFPTDFISRRKWIGSIDRQYERIVHQHLKFGTGLLGVVTFLPVKQRSLVRVVQG